MLVLTRPALKPISIPQKSENKPEASSVSSPPPSDPAQAGREPDSISLRPQGRTGSAPMLNSSPLPSPVSPSPSKFVPPHLRPGFVGKEEKPGPELVKVGFKGKPEIRGPRPGEIQDPGHYRPIKLISLIVFLSLFSLLLSASLLRHRRHHEPFKTDSLRLFPPDTAPTTTVDITKKPG